MEKLDLHELAERYVLDNLSPEGRDYVDKEQLTNEELKKEIDLLKGISYAIQDDDLLDFRAMVREEAEEYRISKKGLRIRRIFIRASAAAASIILVTATVFVLTLQNHRIASSSKVYSNYYRPYQSGLNSRSGSANADDLYGRAVRFYTAMDYKSARASFDSVILKDPGHNGALFFSGISSMELKDFQSAAKRFQRIILNANSLYIEQAEWYSGLALLAIDDRKNAVVHFRNLVISNGYFAAKAKLILNELKDS